MVLTRREEAIATEPTVWLIHAGRQAAYADYFSEEGLVALGFGWVGSLTELTRADAAERLGRTIRPVAKAAGIAAMLQRFYAEVRVNDLVIVPDGPNRRYLLGRVSGEYEFAESEVLADLCHRRTVEWLASVPRDELPLQVRRSLGSPMQLYRPAAQDALLSLPYWKSRRP
jgi:predicted Mrr-cat superfamily restriction endonuclease